MPVRHAGVDIEPVKRPYPDNWAEIRQAVRERAGFRCEHCGAVHGQPHPERGHIVYLHTAHLDQRYDDGVDANDLSRYAALCQGCHNRYDATNRVLTKDAHYASVRKPKGWWQQPKSTRKSAPRWHARPA